MHGVLGPFDVPLPLTGTPGVECRSSSGNHTLVFTFTANVGSGSARVTSGIGSVSRTPTFAGKTMTVNLTGVADPQALAVTLSGITTASSQAVGVTSRGRITDAPSQVLPDTQITINFLGGDANGDRTVNAADATSTRNLSGATTDATNFRADFNIDGTINAADATMARNASGHFVP